MKEIGERFGPFDLTLLETGAYDLQWEGVHMLPEQVIQAHKELRGEWLLPTHNGTFDLGFHPWDEPFERLTMIAQKENVRLVIPKMGELAQIGKLRPQAAWWREPRLGEMH